jgi:hypothetical protein
VVAVCAASPVIVVSMRRLVLSERVFILSFLKALEFVLSGIEFFVASYVGKSSAIKWFYCLIKKIKPLFKKRSCCLKEAAV